MGDGTDDPPQWYVDGMAAWTAIREETKATEASHREDQVLEQEGTEGQRASQPKLDNDPAEQRKLDEEVAKHDEADDGTAMELDEGEMPKANKDKGKEVAGPSGTQSHNADLDQLRAQLRQCDKLRAQLARAIQHRESVPTATCVSTLAAQSAVTMELTDAVQGAGATESASPATRTAETADNVPRGRPRDETDANFEFRKCGMGFWHLQLPKGESTNSMIQLDLDPDETMRDMPAKEQ